MSMRDPSVCPAPGYKLNGGYAERIIVPNLVSVALNSIGNPVTMKVPGKGRIVGMSGCTRADGTPAGMSSVAVQIKIGTTELALVTDGDSSSSYAVFATLFGLDGHRVYPLERDVSREEEWSITIRNYHTGNAYVPVLSFGFCSSE